MSQTIHTDKGEIQLEDLSAEMLHELQIRLPYGFFGPFEKDLNGSRYGFVVQCGEEELPLLKQQPVEYDKETAMALVRLHFMLILQAYNDMREQKLDAVYYATPYFKDKGDGKYESGIVHFIFPGEGPIPESPLTLKVGTLYDGAFGKGATSLLDYFMQGFNKYKEEFGLQYIGLDFRTRSQIGALVNGFMLFGETIIYQGSLQERDPRFALLASLGIDHVVYAPSAPMTIRPEQLKEAKGLL